MCLQEIYGPEQIENWLKDKPDTIIAYKVVARREKRVGEKGKILLSYISPLFHKTCKPFRKTNVLGKKAKHEKIFTDDLQSSYLPYYHLYLHQADAEWSREHGDMVLKCEVPKDQITMIGTQSRSRTAIVTKEFTFVKGDEFFEEEKE